MNNFTWQRKFYFLHGYCYTAMLFRSHSQEMLMSERNWYRYKISDIAEVHIKSCSVLEWRREAAEVCTVARIQLLNPSTATAYNRALVWASRRIHEITLFQNGIRPTIHPAPCPNWGPPIESPLVFFRRPLSRNSTENEVLHESEEQGNGLEKHGWFVSSLPVPDQWLPWATTKCAKT
jgi:hypothetical protein